MFKTLLGVILAPPFCLSHSMSKSSENPAYSACKLYTKFNYFSLPILLWLWTKWSSSFTWINKKLVKTDLPVSGLVSPLFILKTAAIVILLKGSEILSPFCSVAFRQVIIRVKPEPWQSPAGPHMVFLTLISHHVYPHSLCCNQGFLAVLEICQACFCRSVFVFALISP